jgi:hypothetical protein
MIYDLSADRYIAYWYLTYKLVLPSFSISSTPW